MRILHLRLDSCMACPYMRFVADSRVSRTTVACKHRSFGIRLEDAHVILSQPIEWVLAEVPIPGWCPLSGAKAYPQCHLDECKDRKGSALYCEDRECDARFIFVGYEESIGEWLQKEIP